MVLYHEEDMSQMEEDARSGAFEEAAEMAEDTADQLEAAGTALERTVANSLRIFAGRLRKKANP